MIDWEQDPKRTERGIQMLLRRLYPGLRSLDGAGGDGGRDAQLVTPDGLTVFEIKSFGRLDSSRRRQVKRSLRTAVTSTPHMTRWVLVLPLNRTPTRPGRRGSEEAWFDDDLVACAPGVDLEWRGLDWLDTQVAENMDVQRYIEGKDAQLLQRVQEFNLEKAVLAGGAADLTERVATLKRRVDEVSMYWTLDFFVRDGVPSTALRAKDPDAHILDPITITPTVTFRTNRPDDQMLRERFERTLAFGGSVELPAGYVTNLHIEASDEARLLFHDSDPKTSEFAWSTDREELDGTLRCSFQVVSSDERVLAQFPVYIRERTAGSKGVTLYGGDAADIAKFEVNIPRPDRTPGADGPVTMDGAGLHFDLPGSLVGHDIASLLPIMGTFASAVADTHIRFELPGLGYVHGSIIAEATFPQAPETDRLIADLHRMEQHTGSVLRFPANITNADVLDLRTFVRTLEGEAVEYEGGLTLNLRPDRVEAFLETLRNAPGAGTAGGFLGTIDGIELEVGDLRLPYGVAGIWAPHPRLTNLEELEAVVKSGKTPDGSVEARFDPTDTPFQWVSREQAEAYLAAREPGDPS